MRTSSGLLRLLLLSSALVAPSMAWAQDGSAVTQNGTGDQSAPADDAAQGDQAVPDVSIPGADIVVTGRRNVNIQQSTPQVVSVLTSADIERTGEGDIAGALSRVTGLSVVGNGYVYVRGLGDRYSLALLNGLPLPSPEPLKRVVPLDIFPTSVIASGIVQKSYSPNFPGEFGGGVINLTTKAAPKEGFLTISAKVGFDSRTTGQLGYTYFGSPTDWTGFDNGQRNLPPALSRFYNSGQHISDINSQQLTSLGQQLIQPRIAVVQRNSEIPVNSGGNISAGRSFDIGTTTLGLIGTVGYDNSWQTRDITLQLANSVDLSSKTYDYERVATDNHITVDALLGAGLEFGRNKIRLTGLYIRDVNKQARLTNGFDFASSANGVHSIFQDTAWYQRQLFDVQGVGEFKFGDLSVDTRLGYANSQRKAPYETSFRYSQVPDTAAVAGYRGQFVNVLDNQTGDASVGFSDLNEDLYSAGLDLSYKGIPGLVLTTGFAYNDTERDSERRVFSYVARNEGRTLYYGANLDNPGPFSLLRPDYLLEPALLAFLNTNSVNVAITEDTEGSGKFRASLVNYAGYLQGRWEITDAVSIDGGVRYETANQYVRSIELYTTAPFTPSQRNTIDRDYWLPSATVTWELQTGMQVRVSGSKTIARPQFRELLAQGYYDPESNRLFSGNRFLTDSQLYNAEARWEWYFAKDQHLSVAGFYKRIDHPIEQFQTTGGNEVISSFANAPKADLYGAEIEFQKYFDVFANRRLLLIANYTYTSSKVKVGANDTTIAPDSAGLPVPASNLFADGRPLTGQSDHIANLQIGLEQTGGHLSQQTLILNYASKRLVARPENLAQPDIYEYPGFHLDFVVRHGFTVGGVEVEAKLDLRNITGTKYQVYQDNGTNRIYFNRYNVGTSGNFSLSFDF